MGTSIACIQVFTKDCDQNEAHKIIVASLRKRVKSESYIENTNGTLISRYMKDRYTQVNHLRNRNWITVYDSRTDFRKLAQSLSKSVSGTAVTIMLFDSDILHLRRYTNGIMVDEYCNNPDGINHYVDADDPDWRSDWENIAESELLNQTRGSANKWSDLFRPDINPDDIQKIWDSDPLFKDDILWKTAKALGMNQNDILDAGQPGCGVEQFYVQV